MVYNTSLTQKYKKNIFMNTTRREFLKLGTGSAALLGFASSISLTAGCARQPASDYGLNYLTRQDMDLVLAVAPVILNKSYPGELGSQASKRLLIKFDEIINTLDKGSRDLLMQLFDALSYAPLRLVLGAPLSWQAATANDIEHFLNDWKNSFISLKNLGYASLCKLISVSWYMQPETFISSGYPGPPKKIPFPVA